MATGLRWRPNISPVTSAWRTGSGILLANGRYADLFEERAGEWRILEREVIVDRGQIVPMGEKQSDDLLLNLRAKGPRSPHDFSSSLLGGMLDHPP